ncbi:XapX domain-containing protein [Thalassotalea ponticola]|uniref:XapX domain-containing protein n=1 Tax=Thalassotalea ponticola TaxID=1523392 RepID=UPI0025B508C8|nr:XapX domain-containing protein [Thalassotalea ponticola]MDN3651995.1 XapX domain-containing protein [Thalassotalea ponticola]
MQEVILATVAGFVVGILFSFLKLPIPAPPVLPGVMGIVGVYLGGLVYLWIAEKFFTG